MVKKCKYLIRGSEKAKRIAVVLKEITDHLKRNTFIKHKTIYYIHKFLFEFKSNLIKQTVSKFGSILRCTRMSLNISASLLRGSIIWHIVLCNNKRVRIDFSTSGTGTSKIPHEANLIHRIEEKRIVRFILIVEKQTVFSMLTEFVFHAKYDCIIVICSSQPDLATRAIVYKLCHRFLFLIYGFVDINLAVMRIIDFELTVLDLKWVWLWNSCNLLNLALVSWSCVRIT